MAYSTPPDGGLPEWASERLADFERHLAAERGLSPHTVRDFLKSARFKLDCASSAQAVSKATKLGLLVL